MVAKQLKNRISDSHPILCWNHWIFSEVKWQQVISDQGSNKPFQTESIQKFHVKKLPHSSEAGINSNQSGFCEKKSKTQVWTCSSLKVRHDVSCSSVCLEDTILQSRFLTLSSTMHFFRNCLIAGTNWCCKHLDFVNLIEQKNWNIYFLLGQCKQSKCLDFLVLTLGSILGNHSVIDYVHPF